MPPRTNSIPSFLSWPVPRDAEPRRYKDAPTTVLPSGYVLEWCPTHPRATHGVYFQHRLVMECELGRFLEKHERVHHKNRDRADNRPENLDLSASHAEHMREHWQGRGKNNPELIERVRQAAADPTQNVSSLGISPTTVGTICRENGIRWIPYGPWGKGRLLTEQTVREALQGRSTIQAAAILGLNVGTLYNRFGHLLTKRAKPGFLDDYRDEVLRLVYKKRLTRAAVGQRFGVSEVCVTRSIQRWSKQGAKLDGVAIQEPPRVRPGPKPGRKAQNRAQPSPQLASALLGSQRTRQH
jgi:hypothetical protein